MYINYIHIYLFVFTSNKFAMFFFKFNFFSFFYSSQFSCANRFIYRDVTDPNKGNPFHSYNYFKIHDFIYTFSLYI